MWPLRAVCYPGCAGRRSQASVEIDLSKGEVRVQSELAAEHVAQLIKDKGYPVTIA